MESIPYRLSTEEEWEMLLTVIQIFFFPGVMFGMIRLLMLLKKNEQSRWHCRSILPPILPTDLSPTGVFAMAGNVREWTASNFKLYDGSTYVIKDQDTKCKVIRGGSFKIEISSARTTCRGWDLPTSKYLD